MFAEIKVGKMEAEEKGKQQMAKIHFAACWLLLCEKNQFMKNAINSKNYKKRSSEKLKKRLFSIQPRFLLSEKGNSCLMNSKIH